MHEPAISGPYATLHNACGLLRGFLPSDFFQGLTLLGLLGVVGAIWKFLYDFNKDRKATRHQIFERLRNTFDSEKFDEIYSNLDAYYDCETESQKSLVASQIRGLSISDRGGFAAFVENIALLTKSGIFDYRLAHYQFGHYTILCWDCAPFWEGIGEADVKGQKIDGRNDPYWALYKDFVAHMREQAQALKIDPAGEASRLKL